MPCDHRDLSGVLDALIDALADRLVARMGDRRERQVYTSDDLPPRTSRRRFAEVCRSGRVAGARREGRHWTCSLVAWETARTRTRASTIAPAAADVPPATLAARAESLLERSGLRLVRERQISRDLAADAVGRTIEGRPRGRS